MLYTPFKKKLDQLLKNCGNRGQSYTVISSYRSVEEQDELYRQGRGKPGKIVTNAAGGSSAHNFAIAVDLCADQSSTPGLQADWRAESYTILAEEARKLGLETGADYKMRDLGHVQLPIHSKGLKYEFLKTWYKNGGLAEVFMHLDKYKW